MSEEEVFAFPASFAQQRLWFLDQVDPMMAVYNVPLGVRVKGPLDLALLQTCLDEVVRRHESLRTTIEGQEGSALQLVAPRLSLPIEILEARGDEAGALRLANAEAEKPFELAKGPLLRVVAIVLGDTDHMLVFNGHHIVCDGSSLAILCEELSALYAAHASGKPSPLEEVSTQYADFSLWQKEAFTGDELEREVGFWKAQLGGALPVLSLPGDRSRPTTQSFGGGMHRFFVDAELAKKIGVLARQEGASTFMLLLAAWNVLLGRLAGQDEILIGTPVVNRDRAEIARSIGFYTNTVVFRTALGDGTESFRALLARVKKTTMDVFAHQDVPFEKVVEAVHPVRSISHNPIFQAMFGFQRAPESAFALPGATIGTVPVHCAQSKFDLTLDMQDLGDRMQGLLEYASDLFERETVERFAKHYVTLLEAIVEKPDTAVRELPLLDAEERNDVLTRPNQTTADYPRDACLHDLFMAQAVKTPNAVAVEQDGESLTYGDLDSKSTSLAIHLRELGAKPDVPVAIALERTPSMLVALLGVLKAGAAYVPLDPAYPSDRLAYMLEDSKTSIVVTTSELEGDLPLPETCHVVRLDDELGKNHGGTVPKDVTPENRAYVIYTSGSTGKPKGVELPHRAVVNFLTSMARVPGMTAADRLLAVTTLSFDIHVLELFLPLVTGATILLASRDTATDGPALLELLLGSHATVIQATPTTYRMLIEAGWERGNVRALCGGEAMPPQLAAQILERASELWNMFGPTETCVWSTCAKITDADAITIGKPIANTRVYVLDASKNPVPYGVLGDLYLGGDGVARGYLDRPELTAERFVNDPFVPGGRMYKTGDLARLAKDGNLHFVGRGDSQVKVRGFRIELGEIEAVLGKHEEVKSTAVIALTDAAGDARIVAYLSYEAGAAPTPSELRRYLKRTLPDHMIPHLFVTVPEMPLTQNGKLDRKALPDPFEGARRAAEDAAPPETETEKKVAAIWSDLLKVPAVGRLDNFFDLGGHSLLSMQAIHRILAATGHKLNPRAMVFDNLQQIAAECEQT